MWTGRGRGNNVISVRFQHPKPETGFDHVAIEQLCQGSVLCRGSYGSTFFLKTRNQHVADDLCNRIRFPKPQMFVEMFFFSL